MTKNAIGFRNESVGDDHVQYNNVSLFFIKGVDLQQHKKMKIAETNKHKRLCLSHENFWHTHTSTNKAPTYCGRLD